METQTKAKNMQNYARIPIVSVFSLTWARIFAIRVFFVAVYHLVAAE